MLCCLGVAAANRNPRLRMHAPRAMYTTMYLFCLLCFFYVLRCPAFVGATRDAANGHETHDHDSHKRHNAAMVSCVLPSSNCYARKLEISARFTLPPCRHCPHHVVQPLRRHGRWIVMMKWSCSHWFRSGVMGSGYPLASAPHTRAFASGSALACPAACRLMQPSLSGHPAGGVRCSKVSSQILHSLGHLTWGCAARVDPIRSDYDRRPDSSLQLLCSQIVHGLRGLISDNWKNASASARCMFPTSQ